MFISDVKAPKNTWERAYIRFEYERMGLNQVGDKRIHILTDRVCMTCGSKYIGAGYSCSTHCDGLAAMHEDESREDG
jgi:hypothetical protein